ncbi:efflux RND transporter permease subunit [Methyloferula stellata]|uniref:efflux RND transporter permease subunit n=1 Tax=Methyloferula stellata TaxID=876270 RepID=UPI0003A3B84F|nr:efflux RND transporter permease subunit [Methyloferula stellata]
MMGIVRLALQRPYTFVVMAFLILIFGTLSALRTPTDIFPNIGIPVISVIWNYNGLPPDDMANRIVSIHERTLSTTVNDIEHIESQSLPNYGIIKIFFQPSVNINAAQAQVTAISQTILKNLPQGVQPPQILSYNASSVPIIQLVASSSSLSQTELSDLGLNFIRPQLVTIAGAALPYPYGGATRQVQIDLDQRALQSYGLTSSDVASALAIQNLITPVGTQKIGKFEYTVDLNGSPTKVEDFNNLPVKTVNGAVVYMRDIGFVHDGSPPQTNVVQMDGRKAVLMTVLKNGAVSTLDIIGDVKTRFPTLTEGLPSGLNLQLVNDQSGFIRSAISDVVREGLIAAGLTGLMILLFLGSWRSTLIIFVSIPLSVLSALTALSVLGETINVMTLGGLALAVGVLVDEGTVTIENINWHLEQGKPIETAIYDGAGQIFIPATVSLFCICIAFVPMFGLGGVAGFLFRPLAEAVVFAMMASYILSRTLVLTMAKYLLRTHEEDHGERPTRNPLVLIQRAFNHGFEAFRAGYLGVLKLGLNHPLPLVVGFLAFVALSFTLMPHLGQNFFPDIDGGVIKIHVRTQTGTRVEEATAISDRIDVKIREIIPPQQLVNIVDNIGLPNSGINLTYGNSGTIGVEDSDILISLNKSEVGTAEYVKKLREILPKAFPGVTFAFLPADMVSQILNFGSPAPINIQVAGLDYKGDRAYAEMLLRRARFVPGIADARIEEAFQSPALHVAFDRTLAGLTGLTEHDAANNLQNTLSGSSQTQPTYWVNPRNGVSYPVSIQTPQYHMDTITNLKNTPLAGDEGTSQLLGGLATFTPKPLDAVITHYNIRPTVNIYATVQGRDLGAVAADLQKIMDETKGELPTGVHAVMRGQVVTMIDAYTQLFFGLAFAIVLIYLLIVVNFQSWLDPFIIVMALPGALAGIIWMLFLTHTSLSVPALTGAIMCMGVATANSILVISFAREKLAEGMSAFNAALNAGGTRFRPVLMTALAMMIGMMPMAIEEGQNAPLGRAVIGGLLFATCATLLFVPVLFSIVHGREKVKQSHSEPLTGVPSHA